MATLQQIRTKANTVLTDFWSVLETKQAAYYAKHSKYFQLLITQPVVDGEDTTVSFVKPNDELHQLDVDFDFSSPIPFQISVDEWVGPNGQGYSATATIQTLDGKRYSRWRTNAGEDTGWQEIIEL